ncbi:NitT/TauT family transport system permease protein [Propionispira arboris]|uniref:NitT/TauT family transport system permease protein n=1 Tax=Propionispira arboris TaxID=84035 RepID=A0A1H7CCI4_9FIRM|nr:ABC transporter permease [Propionispira arboris]SEJ84330.1 NitT/TauT family transport system permease protein [Propionispira arboris]
MVNEKVNMQVEPMFIAKEQTANRNLKTERKIITKLKDAFTPKGRIKKVYTILLAVGAFLSIILLWMFLTASGTVDALFLPTIENTVHVAIDLLSDGDFLKGIEMTVYRVMSGFFISVVIAIPLGLLIGTYAPASALLEYVFSFIRYLPASAFIPLFILWIGIDESEKIAIIILGSLPQLILMIATNVRNVPMSMIEVSYTLGTSKWDVLWKVILPKAMPDIVDTLRTVLGWAWTYVIVAEMVGASSGIGYMIIQSQRMMDTSRIFVGILTIGFIGMIIDILFKEGHNQLFYWNKDSH